MAIVSRLNNKPKMGKHVSLMQICTIYACSLKTSNALPPVVVAPANSLVKILYMTP